MHGRRFRDVCNIGFQNFWSNSKLKCIQNVLRIECLVAESWRAATAISTSLTVVTPSPAFFAMSAGKPAPRTPDRAGVGSRQLMHFTGCRKCGQVFAPGAPSCACQPWDPVPMTPPQLRGLNTDLFSSPCSTTLSWSPAHVDTPNSHVTTHAGSPASARMMAVTDDTEPLPDVTTPTHAHPEVVDSPRSTTPAKRVGKVVTPLAPKKRKGSELAQSPEAELAQTQPSQSSNGED